MAMQSIRWRNYLKHDEQIKAMIQKSFYYDLVALAQEKEDMRLSYCDIDDMLNDILEKAEDREDYNLCQLIIDVAKRYRIRLR